MLSKVSKAEFIRQATKNGVIFMGVFKHQSLDEIDQRLADIMPQGERNKVTKKSSYRLARHLPDGRESELCIEGSEYTTYEHHKGFWVVYTSIDDGRYRAALIYGK